MTSLKHHTLCLLLLSSASAAYADVLFSEDFENESPIGSAPYKSSVLRPKQNAPGKAVVVIGEKHNIAGSGKAIYLQDRLSGSNDSISLEYDFVDSASRQISALRIDFSFARGATSEKKKDKLYFGAGEFKGSDSSAMNATARRYFQIEFIDNDTIKFNTASGKDRTKQIPQNINNRLSIFVNDHDNKTIQYTDPTSGNTATLQANTVAYYLNGQLAHVVSLDLDDVTAKGTVSTSENNFGRIGFYSSTKSDNNAWVFDDVKVSELKPEEM